MGLPGWFAIHPEVPMFTGATVTALYPFDGHVDLYVTGTDGAVWSTFFEADGGWRPWFLIHPEVKMQPGAPVAAIARNDAHDDLFVTDRNGAIWSSWYEAEPGWSSWFVVSGGGARAGAPITVTSNPHDTVQLYVVYSDGAARSNAWWSGGGWRDWELVGDDTTWPATASVLALWTSYFVIDGEGRARVTWWHEEPNSTQTDDDPGDPYGWQPWRALPSPTALNAAATMTGGVVQWRDNDTQAETTYIDLFATARDGTVWTTHFQTGDIRYASATTPYWAPGQQDPYTGTDRAVSTQSSDLEVAFNPRAATNRALVLPRVPPQ